MFSLIRSNIFNKKLIRINFLSLSIKLIMLGVLGLCMGCADDKSASNEIDYNDKKKLLLL